MTTGQLRDWLNSRTDLQCVQQDILGRRPWIFDADHSYESWRQSMASVLGIKTSEVQIVGSAAVGFSLSPLKPGRPFRALTGAHDTSDIDIAFVAPHVFTAAWDIILSSDRDRSLGSTEQARSKVRLDVYKGLIAHKTIPVNTDPARLLLTAMSLAGSTPPLRGYPIRCRIYRRTEDLRAYHLYSLRLLRQQLEASGK